MAEEERFTINGTLVPGSAFFDVVNPATGKPFARCPDGGKDVLDAAVSAAQAAFITWSQTSLEERRKCFRAAAEAINKQENLNALAYILSQEQGKPLAHALSECGRTALWFSYHAEVEIDYEEVIETRNGKVKIQKKPVGVVGGITPWNYPVSMASWKMAPALITGNTIVLKPSPYTPLSTLRLGKILVNIFPPGVFNIIAGGDDLGRWMTVHPGIRKIAFTGSTATGKKIREVTANQLKLCTLELGGNDAAILLPDVNVDQVAPKIFNLAMANSGQVCCAIKRVFVHESQYDAVVNKLSECAKAAKFGAFDEKGVQFGPLNNKMQYDKVSELVEDARRHGGKIVVGGAALKRDGYFYAPTVIADVKEGMRIVDEEQFGPVIPVLKYKTTDEAIQRANNSNYGLGASIWSSDKAKAESLADRLEAGSVWVNKHLDILPEIPFGGYKQSGLGREHGPYGLHEYLQIKVINTPKL